MPGNMQGFLREQRKRLVREMAEELAKPFPDLARIARLREFERTLGMELEVRR